MSVVNAIGKPMMALMLGIMAPVLIWVGVGSGIYSCYRKSRVKSILTCSASNDCPDGFICANGRCIPE